MLSYFKLFFQTAIYCKIIRIAVNDKHLRICNLQLAHLRNLRIFCESGISPGICEFAIGGLLKKDCLSHSVSTKP